MTTNNAAGVRTHTVTWEDPMRSVAAARSMPGMAFLAAVAAEELPAPPAIRLMNLGFGELEPGRVVFTLTPAEYHYNPLGMVHGGVITTICDTAAGCAVHSTLPEGVGYTTLEIKVNFLRPITVATGLLRCEGKVIYAGGRTATAEAHLTDDAGKLYAHATTTCLMLRPEGEVRP